MFFGGGLGFMVGVGLTDTFKFSKEYTEYNIDPEYNRNGESCKFFARENNPERSKAIPDIIIHKRGCNKYNFAYFEFKAHWNKDKLGKDSDKKTNGFYIISKYV